MPVIPVANPPQDTTDTDDFASEDSNANTHEILGSDEEPQCLVHGTDPSPDFLENSASAASSGSDLQSEAPSVHTTASGHSAPITSPADRRLLVRTADRASASAPRHEVNRACGPPVPPTADNNMSEDSTPGSSVVGAPASPSSGSSAPVDESMSARFSAPHVLASTPMLAPRTRLQKGIRQPK